MHGRSAPVVLGDDRPEVVTELLELPDDGHPLGVELEQGFVVSSEAFEQISTTCLEPLAGGGGVARGETVEEESVLGAGDRSIVGR